MLRQNNESSLQRKQVLLCDDEVHLLRAAEFPFIRAGYDVRLALDGQTAWELIQTRAPDLLICDYQMPNLSGLELLKLVRQDPNLVEMPIIMITAKCFEISRDDLCQRYKVSWILQKPFSPRNLLRRAEELLGTAPVA